MIKHDNKAEELNQRGSVRVGVVWPTIYFYYRKTDKQNIAETFHAHLVDDGTPSPSWDYNVAPTTIQPIIRNNRDTGERELVSLRWGLIPFFTRDIKEVKGISTINARAETVATSRTYREPFKKRRCLVPASGFYEWKRLDAKNKQPFAFDLINGKMMAFAGLWDAWKVATCKAVGVDCPTRKEDRLDRASHRT